MEVYVDMLILENLIMNYIILWVTSRFSKEPSTFLRLTASAFIGAIYVTIVFFPSLKYIYTFIFKICLSLVMVVIAFSPYRIRAFLKILCIFYIVSFVFGGAAFALFYFSNFGAIISNGVFYINNFPIKILIISTLISYFIIKISWTAIQSRLSQENMYIVIDIVYDDKVLKLKALMDTANSLYDPLSNYPVIIVEFEAIKELLPKDLTEVFEKSKQDDFSIISSVVANSEWISRFRLIPFSSLGKENGMLIGFKPDEVLIDQIENKKQINNIIIGIYNKRLSKDESYHALLHPEIINF